MNDSTAAVLLVEDSRSDAVLLQESLMEGQGQGAPGFHFSLAESCAEAVALLQKRSFDVLLLDLSLPDSSGRDTFVRARTVAPHLPIVVLTGEADEAVGLTACSGIFTASLGSCGPRPWMILDSRWLCGVTRTNGRPSAACR